MGWSARDRVDRGERPESLLDRLGDGQAAKLGVLAAQERSGRGVHGWSAMTASRAASRQHPGQPLYHGPFRASRRGAAARPDRAARVAGAGVAARAAVAAGSPLLVSRYR